MKTKLFPVLLFLAFAPPPAASDLILSPALNDNALAAAVNPAGLGAFRRSNLALHSAFNPDSLLVAGVSAGGLGLAMHRTPASTAYYLATGFRPAGRGVYMGMRIGYVGTAGADPDYYKYDMGLMIRPHPALSVGLSTDELVTGGDASPVLKTGVAIRLFDFLCLGASTDLFKNRVPKPALSADLALGGLNITAIADLEARRYAAGASISLAHLEAGLLYPAGRDGAGRFSAWTGLDRKNPIVDPARRVAVIELKGAISDEPPEFSLFGASGALTLVQVLNQLRNAGNDNDVHTVILRIGGLSCGLGMVEEIRGAVLDLRLARKTVVAYLENVELLEYYLATSADKIVVQPAAAWVMAGLSAEVTFFKGTFDKIGVKAEIERVGDYKSYPEVFTRDSMSGAFRKNETDLLASLYDYLIDGIAGARGIDHDTVVSVVDRGNIPLREAVDKRFIDTTGYYNELLARYAGKSEKTLSLLGRTYYGDGWKRRKRIAVINMEGTIIPGESFTDIVSGEAFVGSETMERILKSVRKNRAVRAVVIRINSPGGSAVASDVLWREVGRIREDGKPVVVSMGDVCASGGYYIACAGDTLLCSEGSIVGSIGVFAGKFVLKGLYDKIGIRKEIINFGRNADAFSDYREFTDEQRGLLQASLREFYEGFVAKVALGRGLSRDSVDTLGRGRVFTGLQAQANGLVDEIGGIADAIEIARDMAGLPDTENPEIEVFPKPKTFFSGMAEGEEARFRSFRKALDALNSNHALALLPCRVRVK